jgi:death on curing protein
VEDVLHLHAAELRVSFDEARHHVLSYDSLESALMRPVNAVAYEDADLPAQASQLLWGIIKDHPFIDGNKRTAWMTTQYFLNLHGYLMDESYDGAFETVKNIAEGTMDREQVEAWIRENLIEISQRTLPGIGLPFPRRSRRSR